MNMMKKLTAEVILIVLLVSVLIFAAACKNSENDKRIFSDGEITNSDFELELGDFWQSDCPDGVVSPDDTCSFNGEKSLKIGSDGEYSASVVQYISNLTPGYYYIEAYTLNEGNQNHCYIYGKGSEQGLCMTAVPKTIRDNSWTKVTVRGICVSEDGILEIGICSEGSGQSVNIDSVSLVYEKDQSRQYECLFGGAVSWLDWVEDLGGKYYRSDNTEADALQIMAENGCNFVRLELYNNPGDYINENGDKFPKGYKDADAIFDLAVRAHNKGMKIQLSFMYSDYWGNDAIPHDWMDKISTLDSHDEITETLTQCLYDYTYGFMKRLADEGIYPEYVSLGNEMQGGILTPYGSSWESEDSIEAFCSFMDAGYRAVKEVSPDSRIVLHIACNADDMFWESRRGSGVWFFELCEERGIKYDVIGTSYYPYWAQTDSVYAVKSALDTGDLTEWCNMMVDTFNKDILVMESGINWGKPGQLSNNGAYTGIYKYTPEDQRNFMYELINAIKSVKDGRCIGDLYWDPVLVRQEGVGWAIRSATDTPRENCVETTTFFDYDHVALPVLDAYRYNTAGSSDAYIFGSVTDANGVPVAEQAVSFTFCQKSYVVTTDKYGDFYTSVAPGKGILTTDGVYSQSIELHPGTFTAIDLTINQ